MTQAVHAWRCASGVRSSWGSSTTSTCTSTTLPSRAGTAFSSQIAPPRTVPRTVIADDYTRRRVPTLPSSAFRHGRTKGNVCGGLSSPLTTLPRRCRRHRCRPYWRCHRHRCRPHSEMPSSPLPTLLGDAVVTAADLTRRCRRGGRSVEGVVVSAVDPTTGDPVVAVADHRGVPSEARPQGGAKKAGSVFT